MSENQDPKKDDKNEFDPYSFFKLQGPEEDDDKKKKNNKNKKRFPFLGVLLLILITVTVADFLFLGKSNSTVEFSKFKQMVMDGTIVEVEIADNYYIGYGKEEIAFEHSPVQKGLQLFKAEQKPLRKMYRTAGYPMNSFIELLDEKGLTYKFVEKTNNAIISWLLNMILPFGIIFLLYFILFRKMGGGAGGGVGSIFAGGSRAKAVEEGKVKTRFADVAGVDEAKEELVEVVDFLKEPKKYTEIGGKIPKGVLLVGPPGTGKTLLARAVAGEAGVPFFSISGSDFVEMFVGVCASRVSDLFRQARE